MQCPDSSRNTVANSTAAVATFYYLGNKIMALYYWQKSNGLANFGDYAGVYLYHKITGQRPSRRRPGEKHWVTIGSLLSYHHLTPHSMIWGTGIISSQATFPAPASIFAVRGPLSRDQCLAQGYSCPKIYGDPALLLPRFYSGSRTRRIPLGIILHHRDMVPTSRKSGTRYITLTHDDGDDEAFESIVDKITNCQVVVSSSLHGIIVAHAYGIPAIWCTFGRQVGPDDTKFLDYYQGIGITTVTSPLVIGDEVLTLAQWRSAIRDFPQPSFPINTDALWLSCPFRNYTTII